MDGIYGPLQAPLPCRSLADTLHDHRPVFTHGDLQDENIDSAAHEIERGRKEGVHGHSGELGAICMVSRLLRFCITACTNLAGNECAELRPAGLNMYPKEFPLVFLFGR